MMQLDYRRGTQQPNAKLTDESVREIRKAYDALMARPRGKRRGSLKAVAARFGVSAARISRIGLRREWRHVEEGAEL